MRFSYIYFSRWMRKRSAIAGNSCDSWLQMCWNRSEGWWWYWCVDVENNNQNEWKGRWFSTDNSTYYQIKWHQHTHHERRNNKKTGERGDGVTGSRSYLSFMNECLREQSRALSRSFVRSLPKHISIRIIWYLFIHNVHANATKGHTNVHHRQCTKTLCTCSTQYHCEWETGYRSFIIATSYIHELYYLSVSLNKMLLFALCSSTRTLSYNSQTYKQQKLLVVFLPLR